MKKAYKIDNEGIYIEDYFYEDGHEVGTSMITVAIPQQGLYVPKWNGNEWIEGAAQDYINLIKSLKMKEPTADEILRAKLLKDNANIQMQLEAQQKLNADLLLKLSKLGGVTNV